MDTETPEAEGVSFDIASNLEEEEVSDEDREKRRAGLVDTIAVLVAAGDPLGMAPGLKKQLEAMPAAPEPIHRALADANKMSAAAARKEREAAALRLKLEAARKAVDELQASLTAVEAEAARVRQASINASARYAALSAQAQAPGAAAPVAVAPAPTPSPTPEMATAMQQLAARSAATLVATTGGHPKGPTKETNEAFERAVQEAFMAGLTARVPAVAPAAPLAPGGAPVAPAAPPAG